MESCSYHNSFFDERCKKCKKEYLLLKGLEVKENWLIKSIDGIGNTRKLHYKEFNEEKAKELYEKLFVYYLKKTGDEYKASNKAKTVIKKQCNIRNLTHWSWL